jgi:hypothetical protein
VGALGFSHPYIPGSSGIAVKIEALKGSYLAWAAENRKLRELIASGELIIVRDERELSVVSSR